MNKCLLSIVIFSCLANGLFALDHNSTVPGDSIIVQYDESYGLIYEHTMQSKQTIYGLARFFGYKPVDIYEINPALKDRMPQIDEKLLIPLRKDILVYDELAAAPANNFVPVFYRVKPKDNFFRIARIYFDQSIENLLAINQVNSFELEIDQLLLVAWIPVAPNQKTRVMQDKANPAPVKTEVLAVKENPKLNELVLDQVPKSDEKDDRPVFRKKINDTRSAQQQKAREWEKLQESIDEIIEISKSYKEKESESVVEENTIEIAPDSMIFSEEILNSNLIGDLDPDPELKISESRGIAIWNESGSGQHQMFALHPSARVNSVIELYNPMMERKAYAKVIGNIPPNTYPDDVKVIISPKTAKALGVVDPRFFVKMRYLE